MPRKRQRSRPARRNRAPMYLYVGFFVLWAAASALLVQGSLRSEAIGDLTPVWIAVAGTGILLVALVERDVVGRRRAAELLRERESLIESIGVVTDPKLSQLPLYQLLDELLGRARTVMQADVAAVALYDRQLRTLQPTATSGLRPGQEPGTAALGAGLVGRVASARRGQVALEAPADPGVIAGVASVVVVPLVAEGQLVGVLQLGTKQRREFRADEVRVLQVVADRVAVAVDAARLDREAQRARLAVEGARQRLALLADAGEVLARSFERAEEMAEQLSESIVPDYADWFAYHEVDRDGVAQLVTWRASDEIDPGAVGGGDWSPIVLAAVAQRSPGLAWGDELRDPDHRVAAHLRLTSVAAIPVMRGDDVIGAMTFGTAGRRRGFRAGDVATGQDLAARFAVALERVELAGQTQRSAVRAARHAEQLQRLTEGAFAINASVTAEQLAVVVAEQAAVILDADAAAVELQMGARVQRVRAGAEKDPPRAHRLIAALFHGPSAPTTGSVTVVRAAAPFSKEDEAILSSLAQIASVAVTNAGLYADVQESRTRLQALYDASPVAIVELDAGGRGVRWNRAAETMFGWPAHGEADQPPLPLPAPAAHVAEQVLAGADARGVDVVLGEEGSAIAAELVAVPLQEQGQVVGAVLAAVDVTERKVVAEQLQQAQRMESMARMAGGIAHDFNNVLMVITGYADLVLRRQLEEEVRADVDAMRAAAVRAADFTRKLLTISRRQVVQPESVDVAAAVSSLEAVLRVMLGSGVQLEVDVDDPPCVLIDPAQLEQVLLNLSINARDAMDGAGSLHVAACRSDDGWAELVVRDTGPGMDPHTVEHCFEPFFTTKDRTKGTGLGLSTVYGVVTQAGGTISVQSEVGAGTTFVVRLPPTEVEPTGSARPAVMAPAPGLRVLVVDDEPEVRAIVADLLELEGHFVTVAADGESALRAVAEQVPDVLLTDVVMPGMRGPDLASAVTAAHPEVRVVLMSSHVDEELAIDERLAQAPFLAKPFSGEALLEVLSGLGSSVPR